MTSPFLEEVQSLSEWEKGHLTEEKQGSPAKKLKGPVTDEEIDKITTKKPNVSLSNEEDTSLQKTAKRQLVPVTDEEFDDIKMEKTNVDLSHEGDTSLQKTAQRKLVPVTDEEFDDIKMEKTNVDLSNVEDTSLQKTAKTKLVPVTDEEFDDIKMEKTNVDLSNVEGASPDKENGGLSDGDFEKVETPEPNVHSSNGKDGNPDKTTENDHITEEGFLKVDKRINISFSSDEDLEEPDVPVDKQKWTWTLDMYWQEKTTLGQAEYFLDLCQSRDSTRLSDLHCANPDHHRLDKIDGHFELYKMVYQWMEANMDFEAVPNSRSIAYYLTNSWLDVFHYVADTENITRSRPMYFDFAKFVVIYSLAVEGCLKWPTLYDKLDHIANLRQSTSLPRNEKALHLALKDCLQHMTDETVVQNFLAEFMSSRPPTFILSTLIRLLQGNTEPKTKKDIIMDKLALKYFTTMRTIFKAFGKNGRKLDFGFYTNGLRAITLCNALLKQFKDEEERIREKYRVLTRPTCESWEARMKYIDIMQTFVIATCYQVQTKFQIWKCGACYEKSVLKEEKEDRITYSSK